MMKKLMLAGVTALGLATFAIGPVVPAAQAASVTMSYHVGPGPGYHHHHRHRARVMVCENIWHHHHRVRVCHRVWRWR